MPIVLEPTPTTAELLVFDPVSEGAANTPLTIGSSGGLLLMAHSYPAPNQQRVMVGGIDTTGSRVAARTYENRTISLTLEATADGGTALETTLAAVEAKFAKLSREGGTLQRTFANGSKITFDILAGDTYEPRFDIAYHAGGLAVIELSFMALPYWRGTERTIPVTSTAIPSGVVVTSTEAVGGTVPALGRLNVSNGAAFTQGRLFLGQRPRDTAAASAMHIEAETAGAATAAVAGASNGTAVTYTVSTDNTKVAQTYSSVGTASTHVGTYRVLYRVRVLGGSDIYTIDFKWNVIGEEPRTVTISRTINGDTLWNLVDFGTITIPSALEVDDSRWYGDFFARWTGSNYTLHSDFILLIPTNPGAEVSTVGEAHAMGASANAEWRHNRYVRQQSTGAPYTRGPRLEGDYFTLPPTGLVDVIAKASRFNDPKIVDSSASDPITATLFATPRGLTVPN